MRMGTTDLGQLVAGIVKQWDGVGVRPYRFGGVDVRLVHHALVQRALGEFGHESTAVDVCTGPDSAE